MQIEDEVLALINESRPGWLEPFNSKESRDYIVQQIQELNDLIAEIPEVPVKKDARLFERIEHQADLISRNAEVMQVELEDQNESKKNEATLADVEVGDVVRFDGKDGYEYPGRVIRIDNESAYPIRVEVEGFQRSILPEEIIKVTKPDSKFEGLDNGQILLQDLIELAKSNNLPLNSAILIPSRSGGRTLAGNAKLVHFTGNNYGIELQE